MISGPARDAPTAVPDAEAGAGLPPGPGGSAWRNFARYMRDPLGTMDGYARDHGGVAYVRFPGGHSFYFVSDAALVRRALVEDNAAFVKGRALQAARRLLGDGLLTSEGADHLRRRRMIQPIFRHDQIARYGDVMIAAAEDVAAGWTPGATVDLNREMTRIALRVVGRTIFDADVESEAPEIAAVLDAGMRVFHRFLLPGAELLWRLPLPATRGFNAAKRDIDAFLERLVREHSAALGGADLVSVLAALEDGGSGGRRLTDAEIRDEAITLMLAGHETTAQALTWAWYLLAQNPAAAAALAAELRSVLGDRPLETADYERLPYTQAVVRETLRLFPPVWALARIATRPYRLGPYAVPEGGTIVTSQWVVQRRPDYFADPLRFAPERWLDGPPPPAGAYFPFAAGPRMCIGERFAMLEGVLVLAAIARAWRPVPEVERPRLDARFTLRPHGGLPAQVRAA
jgi:cytochrome P450